MPKYTLSTLITALALFGATSSGYAQDTKTDDIFPDEMLPSDIFTIDPKKVDTFIDVGVGVLSRPAYLGSDERQTNVLPYINAEYKGRWYLNPIEGIGVHAIRNKRLRLSAGVNLIGGRDADETPYDNDLFEIDTGAGAYGAVRYSFKYAAMDIIGTVPVLGDVDGAEVEARLTTLFPVTKNFRIAPGLGATFQSDAWVNSYYGLTPEQAAISQTALLDYSGGLTSWTGNLIGFWVPKDDVTVVGALAYESLVGDVRDSPLAAKNDGLTMTFAVARRF